MSFISFNAYLNDSTSPVALLIFTVKDVRPFKLPNRSDTEMTAFSSFNNWLKYADASLAALFVCSKVVTFAPDFIRDLSPIDCL